jgi:putative hydrolase of the HAD superfamily
VYQAVCFDLFNTLVNVGRVPVSVGALTADILGVDHETWRRACFGQHHEICRPSRSLDNLRRMAWSIDPAIPESRIRAAAEARQHRFDHALRDVDAGTLAVLGRMRRAGLRLALISNASTDEVRAWPDSPLAALFDHAIFSCHCGFKKPDAAIYRYALEKLAVPASACLFVGDGGSDEHRGAQAVGMTPVLLTEHIRPQRARDLQQDLAEVVTGSVARLADIEALLRAGPVKAARKQKRPV